VAANQKPVIVRRFSQGWVPGYANQRKLVEGGRLEILDTAGKLLQFPLAEVKHVSFVREFGPAGHAEPERLLRKTFTTRPRTAGVTVRVHFKDKDILEGIAVNDLTLFENDGLLLAPPDTRSNVQRIYIPRTAMEAMEILAVIKAPVARRKIPLAQDDLFAAFPLTSSRLN